MMWWLFLIVVLVLGCFRTLEDLSLNAAYVNLARALVRPDGPADGAADGPSTRHYLERVAEQLSAAVAAQPTERRMWDEALVWFRLGHYEQAAVALPPIGPELLPPALVVKGTAPARPFVTSISYGGLPAVDWQWIIANQPPPEYSILRGMLAAQRAGSSEGWTEALEHYRLALAVAPQSYDGVLYRYYYQALAHSSDAVDRQVADSILRLLPADLDMDPSTLILDESLATDASGYAVSHVEDGCGNLASFEYDEDALVRGPLLPMRFTWRCGVADGQGQAVVQEVLAVNLIPNSGFEWNQVEGRVYPVGHERSLHHDDNLSHRFLSTQEREAVTENVAAIDKTPPANQASFVSAPISVHPGACYLHAAWAKSPQGKGQLAVLWRESRILYQLSGHYADTDPSRAEEWQLVAQVVQAPSDAAFADAVVGYQGTAVPHYFDNHLFVVLTRSPCTVDITPP